MERLLKKMGVISTSSGGGGGGAALPPAIASIVVKSTTYLAQIADPAIKQIIITFPASITDPNKEMIIPTEILLRSELTCPSVRLGPLPGRYRGTRPPADLPTARWGLLPLLPAPRAVRCLRD